MNIKRSLRHSFPAAALVLAALLLTGCPTTQQTQAPEIPVPPPEQPVAAPRPKQLVVSFRIGSLDLTKGTGFRIERSHLEDLWAFCKSQKLDMLTMQGVARYPELKTRVDVVDDLTGISGMFPAFGENTTISGRQTGNVIFSKYPIISQANNPYQGIHSTNFEAAMQATVDLGETQVVVVSTELPVNALKSEIQSCLGSIERLRNMYAANPFVAAGNFPKDPPGAQFPSFKSISPSAAAVPSYWFSVMGGADSVAIIGSSTAKSPLGQTHVAEFGLYR